MAKISDKLHVHCKKAVDIMTDVLKVEDDKFFLVEHPDFVTHKFNRSKAGSQAFSLSG